MPHRALMMSGTASVTCSRVVNGASRVARCASRGASLRVISVTSASVPSDPVMSCVRSYPVDDLTYLPPVRITSPQASTASRPRT